MTVAIRRHSSVKLRHPHPQVLLRQLLLRPQLQLRHRHQPQPQPTATERQHQQRRPRPHLLLQRPRRHQHQLLLRQARRGPRQHQGLARHQGLAPLRRRVRRRFLKVSGIICGSACPAVARGMKSFQKIALLPPRAHEKNQLFPPLARSRQPRKSSNVKDAGVPRFALPSLLFLRNCSGNYAAESK